MRHYSVAILLCIVLSCSPAGEDGIQQDITNRLVKIDESVYNHPQAAVDSLKRIKETPLNEYNNAFSLLLYSIAYEQINGSSNPDSLNQIPSEIFLKDEDFFNYSRSLLYNSISLYSKNRFDSSAYILIKQSEDYFIRASKKDYNTLSTLYLYLGRLYRARGNPGEATKCIRNSIDFSTKANNKNTVLNGRLELFWINLGLKNYSEALTNIAIFADEVQMPDYISYNLNLALFSYHSARRETNISIEYLKKMIDIAEGADLDVSYPKLYYLVASFFKRTGNIDSTLHYSKLSVSSIRDSSLTESHFYYRYLADILYETGDFKSAFEYSRKAYQSYLVAFTKHSQNRVMEIERKYDISNKDKIINTIRIKNRILLITIASLVILFVVLLFALTKRLRNNFNKVISASLEMDSYKQDNRKLWITSEICKATSSIMPELLEDVYKEALRCRRTSSEIFDSLNSLIDKTNALNRSSLASITAKEEFLELYKHLPYIDKLTDYEKLIYILSEDGFSNVEIAGFLNTTQSSIRSLKARLSKKFNGNL